MVLTNLQCWANDWDIQSNVENPNLDRNVDLFNPRTVNSNISHISSNGYYGFLNLNNHDINIELNSVENNRVKQLNSYKANEMMALDTPMMDTVEKPSNGENFTKIANGNFPAITNEHTNKNNFSISNGASGGGGFDRKKRSCIDDDEHRTEGVTNAKRVCPNHTWVRQDFQNDAAEPMFISEDCPQQNYEEPMIIEPANNKYENNNLNSDTDFQDIQIDKKLSFCTYQVSIKNNIYKKTISSHQDSEILQFDLIRTPNSKKFDIINNDEKFITFKNPLFDEFNSSQVLNSIDENILLENLYYQTHGGGGEYRTWQNNTEI